MSVKVQGWVWDQPLPTSEKIVLLKLADHADHDGGNVYPSVSSLATATGLSERQVQRHLKSFVSRGILAIDENERGGRGKTRVYRFTFQMPAPKRVTPVTEKGDTDVSDSKLGKDDTSDTLSGQQTVTPVTPIDAKRVTSATAKGDICDIKRVTSATEKGDTHARAKVNHPEPSGEPSGNRERARSTRRAPATPLPEDFTVTDHMRAKAVADYGVPADAIDRETDKFLTNALAKGLRYVDWRAAWYTWMQRVNEFTPRFGPRFGSSRPTQPPNIQTHRHDDEIDYFEGYASKAGGTR